jgi:hypothetical protein
MNKSNDKFENDGIHNSSCLRADGCFKRHDIPRKDEFLTKDENSRAELRTFSRAESQERRLIAKVAILQRMGCQLRANETLHGYVARHSFRLKETGDSKY